jgi:hypothetical protein
MARPMPQIGMTTARSWSQPSVQRQAREVARMEGLDMATTEMATTDENGYFWQGVAFLLILAVLFVLSQLVGLAAIYVGDEYSSPSWNEHSVPPPKMY